ncbi:Ku protein [Rhizobium sp. ARZ01]|uniref:non-homologous end joining protein Ku n=1 Tax=Rhizobium sp. ARZ01 TaxID=2769313 RepID=UPI00177E26AA|nr:Ku protein [Rhizobium sp. ARZ01]MBD9375592.1 Ku protein [Rhizobium sp. ARZ01]
MAVRPYWKGYLKLSLVTCPVAMSPATSESEKVRFHTINRATHNRVVSHYVDSVTGKEVADKDEVKGFERGGEYVLLEEDELQAVNLESVRTIEINSFVPRESIDWIWLDKAHYLVPNDKVGEDAFAVIRDAMAAEDVVGISRLVIGRREHAIMLEPRGNGIVVWTLHYGDEVRDEDEYFDRISADTDPKLLEIAQEVIQGQTKHWSPSFVKDPMQESLLKIIAAKKKGLKKFAKPVEVPAAAKSNVVDLMAALKKSLEGSSKKSSSKAKR